MVTSVAFIFRFVTNVPSAQEIQFYFPIQGQKDPSRAEFPYPHQQISGQDGVHSYSHNRHEVACSVVFSLQVLQA